MFRRVAMRLIVVSWSTVMVFTGCIVPPPIEPEELELNLPPVLEFITPESPTQTITDPQAVTLSARAFDPNPEEELFFAWIGSSIGTQQLLSTRRSIDDELFNGALYSFDEIEFTLNPCQEQLRGETSETIWLYVSDRRLQQRTETSIETEDDGYITATSWEFDIRPGACDAL